METKKTIMPMVTSKIVSYEVTQEVKKVPRCHDKEVFTITRLVKREDDTVRIPIAEIKGTYSVRLLRKDDITSHIYYSTEEHKIDCLVKMKESLMDRFYEDAPTKDCPEVKVCEKIDELISLIKKEF